FADLASRGLLDKFRDACASSRSDAVIGSALKSMRCVSMHAEPPRSAANRSRIEPRGLDENVLSRLCDHRCFATHDSGERDSLRSIGDDQVFRAELALDAIQRFQYFAVFCATNDDLAIELIEIESMCRLTQFVEDVVRGVGHVGDRALIDEF